VEREKMRKMINGKTLILTILLTMALLLQASLLVLAAEPAPGVTILKVDRDDILQLPKDFRTPNDVFKRSTKDGKMPSRLGMDKLNLSGSSYYSQLEFAKMLTKLPQDRLVILDLRLEPHGYLDGIGVSWYSAYKRANWGKSSAELEIIERNLLNSTLTGPVEVARLDSEKSVASKTELNVTHALTEGDLAALFGVKYFRIHVADYTKPTDENVDQFLNFYKKLPKDAWLHLHCEAGEGRTTVFMAMVDMLHNAKDVSYDDIMSRQWLIGGQDIRISTSSDPLKKVGYADRAAFTKHFYDYVTQRPNDSMTWTEWAKQHNYN
jgi:hypothetical protein